jgi:hypothetical protein
LFGFGQGACQSAQSFRHCCLPRLSSVVDSANIQKGLTLSFAM